MSSQAQVNSKLSTQSIPGTPLQQMWHVLNFHEHRLVQMNESVQQLNKMTEMKIGLVEKTVEGKINQSLGIYMESLLERVAALETALKAEELKKNKKKSHKIADSSK